MPGSVTRSGFCASFSFPSEQSGSSDPLKHTAVTSQQKEFYSASYGRGYAPDDRIDKLIGLARTLRAEKILDVGCGDGSITLALKHALGATYAFGIEISPQGAQLARDKGIVCHPLNVDESPLPFDENSMDAIYAGEIIEHLYDPDKFLDEVYRVLHPDGFAIIDTPNLGWWVDRLSLLLGYQPLSTESSLRFGGAGKLLGSAATGGGGHLRILTLRAFKQLLENHGFKVRKIIGAAGAKQSQLSFPFGHLYRAINGFLSRSPSLAVCVMCLVVKNDSRSGPPRDRGEGGGGTP